MNLSEEQKRLLTKFEEADFLVVHGLKHTIDYIGEGKQGVIVWKREVKSYDADDKKHYKGFYLSGSVFLNPHIPESEKAFFDVLENEEDLKVNFNYFDEVVNENLIAHHFTIV